MLSGGTASGTQVLSGGAEAVFGSETGAVDNGGTITISSGGTADHLTISSGVLAVLGTVTSFATVFSGGVENISSG